MSIVEYTEQELVELFNSKSVNGELSLTDLTIIAFDIRFPAKLSQKTVEKLNELSKDFRKYSDTKEKLADKYCEQLYLIEEMIALINGEFDDDALDTITLREIDTIKQKESIVIKEIDVLEEELDGINKIFTKP